VVTTDAIKRRKRAVNQSTIIPQSAPSPQFASRTIIGTRKQAVEGGQYSDSDGESCVEGEDVEGKVEGEDVVSSVQDEDVIFQPLVPSNVRVVIRHMGYLATSSLMSRTLTAILHSAVASAHKPILATVAKELYKSRTFDYCWTCG